MAGTDYRAETRKAAERHGLDPDVFERQIQQESGFNPSARSGAGAIGIAQIMPATARGWGVDPSNPIASLDAAAKNMASYVKRFGGVENALRAYNAGEGAIEKSRGYAETNNYVKTIMGGKASTGAKAKTPTTPSAPTQAPTASGPSAASARRAALQQYVLAQGTQDEPDSALNLANGLRAARQIQDPAPDARTALKQRRTSAPKSRTGGEHLSGSKVLELIYNDGGKGFGIKDGQTVDGAGVFSAVWAGHANHVHVAAGPKTVVALGKKAQEMGLHVGENSHFGGENPASHVAGSYHNEDEAIDVSGDAAKMKAFAKEVAQYNKSRTV